MRFLNNERTLAYVTCEKIASDAVIRQIAHSNYLRLMIAPVIGSINIAQ